MFRIRLPTTLKKSSAKSKNEAQKPSSAGSSIISRKNEPKPDFKPFTKESAEKFDNKTVKIARECGFARKRKSSIEDESVLPDKYEPFPSNLYGKPLEEIDNFIYEETFCVVSKRFRKNYVHRFTATHSFFLFSPWNPIRRTMVYIATNQIFDYVVMATILLNCVFLAKTDSVDEAEYIFLAIYTGEMIIKSIAKGFIINKYTYLRNPWNWLDFVVITSGYATIGMEVGNLAGLRTFRVLRALKTVSIMPGLKTIINALLHSFRQLAEVMTLTIFCLMVFALFALQVYMGELRNKCVHIANYSTKYQWHRWIADEQNWLVDEQSGGPVLCGNSTGARHCKEGYQCLQVGENPNHGFTNFDNFMWSMLTTFQLITLDYWENVYNIVLATCGPFSVIFFTVVVFFGSFYLINLMLAVVALSYEEEAEITQEERRKDLSDHREDSTFSFDPTRIPVKKLDKNNRKKLDSRKGVLLSSYSRKRTRRRKRRGGVVGPGAASEAGSHTQSATPSPRHSCGTTTPPPPPPMPPPPPPPMPKLPSPQPHLTPPPSSAVHDTLHPSVALGRLHRNHLGSRQGSNNTSDGNNRESSLDDSGVVDDHEECDVTSEDVTNAQHQQTKFEPAFTEIREVEKEKKFKKCNGLKGKKPREFNDILPENEFISQVVVINNLPDRNCANCSKCCFDYVLWLRVQNCLYKIVRDPLFELLITICIILNTFFLAVEHHGMSEDLKRLLDIGNKVFTLIFTLECSMKIMALSTHFFNCGWNIFDLIIVSASLLDLSFEMIDGLSVLRSLRLLRVLKLAQSWTTMKVLLSIIISTIGALGNLTFVLVIIIYIFAVIGMQLFSKEYTPEKFAPDPVPRWNFSDFFHSFMMIFRILCGEWIEPLWDCMRAEEAEGFGTCFAIFLPTLVMGNFMVLNLFLALLLNSFNSEELKSKKEEVGESSKLARSFERVRSIIRKRRRKSVQETSENQANLKLEELVIKMMKTKKNPNVADTTFIEEAEEQNESETSARNEQETILPSFRVQGTAKHQDTMSLQDVDLLNDDQADEHEVYINDPDKQQVPHIERTLTEDSADTGYFQSTLNQPSPACSLHHSDNDDLYQQIMHEVMLNAPSLSAPDSDFHLTNDNNYDNSDKNSPPNRTHRRSYMLAIRRESSREALNFVDPELGNKPEDPLEKVEEVHHPDEPPKKKSWMALASYVDELTLGGRRDSKGRFIDNLGSFPGFGYAKKVKVPQDCFPKHFYDKCPACENCIDSFFGERWMEFRSRVLTMVDNPYFEWFILVLIFASSITLCFEDIYLDNNILLKKVLYWTNFVFCVIFIIEMLLKWIAMGFYKYFSSFWTVLDFVIAFMSVFSLVIEENENWKVLRSLRTLRALRPLRAIARWQGMKIVVNALMYAIPSIFNVLLVCLVFWLIFSIMGVQFFGGKFYKCVNEEGERLEPEDVENKTQCLEKNYTWINSKISFDNVGIGYLALFQVATFEGWMEVMQDAVDATGVDKQPQREANIYAYIYFVIFIVCGAFFTLNLFIGVIIDNFNMLKKKYEGGVLEMFLTESQKHYYTAMKKLGRKKPQKVIKRPINKFLAAFYDLANSRRFEIAIFVLIFLNMLSMGIEHYNQRRAIFFVLQVSNAFFTTVFALEALVKMIGLRFHYFTVPWNIFDFLLVLASILGILMEDVMIDFPVSPTLLRVVRVFRIGRILRLIKAAKGIRKLLFALVVSLPALFNIGALLGLITFIYAIIGMSVFGHVKQQRALNDMVNFETFGRSMQLLFRLMTSAGWNDVLESLMIQPPDCDPNFKNLPNGDCGNPVLAITYFTSFIIISYMIVINMYIAIILENFNQAHQEEEIGIVEDDLEMFYVRWSKYDPHATQFIGFTQLSDFIASLDPPLGIPKPNIVALVSFNLPIARGHKIHCLDILHALVKHVLGHVEETEEFKKLQEQMDDKFKKQFPTRKELEIVSSTRLWKRQDKAARMIQRAYREYKRRRKEREEGDVDEVTQSSSPGGGWQGRLSSFLHVHRGSRASSRKSSRASDASDASEINSSMWLNLPLFLLTSTQVNGEDSAPPPPPPLPEDDISPKIDVCITVSEPSPESKPENEPPVVTQCSLELPESAVSITVTDASPESSDTAQSPPSTATSTTNTAHQKRAAFRRGSEAVTIHHALVHRESGDER
ncbi:sodium channel protein 60E isoform X2 [Planococcus citri]|uniref:sodium channel protein 60E isoform X2 n=1 Tax=Planococcus citri TaxID=170843 RepID=UPI0031F7F8A6